MPPQTMPGEAPGVNAISSAASAPQRAPLTRGRVSSRRASPDAASVLLMPSASGSRSARGGARQAEGKAWPGWEGGQAARKARGANGHILYLRPREAPQRCCLRRHSAPPRLCGHVRPRMRRRAPRKAKAEAGAQEGEGGRPGWGGRPRKPGKRRGTFCDQRRLSHLAVPVLPQRRLWGGRWREIEPSVGERIRGGGWSVTLECSLNYRRWRPNYGQMRLRRMPAGRKRRPRGTAAGRRCRRATRACPRCCAGGTGCVPFCLRGRCA